MLYVNCRSLSLIALLFVVGCKSPDLEVGSLGKKLPAPILKNTNMSEQDGVEDGGYIHLQGLCDSRINSLMVKVDSSDWFHPRLNPDITDTELTEPVTNDTDCSDGTFNIYLTKSDAPSYGVDSDIVQSVYLKGLTLIGDTDFIKVLKVAGTPDTPGSGGGSVSGPAVGYNITGTYSIIIGECIPYSVNRIDSDYGSSLPAPHSINFEISSGSPSVADIYSDNICSMKATSLNMTSGQSSTPFFVKAMIFPVGLTISVLSEEGHTAEKYIQTSARPTKFYAHHNGVKNGCHKVGVTLIDAAIGTTVIADTSISAPFNIFGIDTGSNSTSLKAYQDAACTSQLVENYINIQAGSDSGYIYVKETAGYNSYNFVIDTMPAMGVVQGSSVTFPNP